MELFNNIIEILTVLTPILFGIFWSRLKGYRTQILQVITVMIGYVTATSEIIPAIAAIVKFNPVTIQSILMSVLAILNIWLRKITDTPAGKISELPQALRARKK